MTARIPASIAAAAAALVLSASGAARHANDGLPTSIAALGDSITQAACTDPSCTDRPSNSWSTGTNRRVDSHLERLRRLFHGTISVRAYNFASSFGATMADLPSQAREAVRRHVAYVTIELGENDLCGATTPRAFRASLERGLDVLAARPTKVLLLSIEDITAHWTVFRHDPNAARALRAGAVLDCGLGYYTTTESALAKIRARTETLNSILRDVCAAHPLCLYDAGTYNHLRLEAGYFSPADYQHLSIEGQHALAAAEWAVAQRILYL